MWLASADTAEGPSLGWGIFSFNAAIVALAPFEGAVTELMRSLPLSDVPRGQGPGATAGLGRIR